MIVNRSYIFWNFNSLDWRCWKSIVLVNEWASWCMAALACAVLLWMAVL